MPKSKIAISLDETILMQLDLLVQQGVFPNRSQALEIALKDKIERMERGRLAREAAKLDPHFEKSLADEGLSEDEAAWPEY